MEIKNVLLVGCGGGGNYILGALACSFPKLIVAEGDTYEDKNLNRQPHAITGENKANAAVAQLANKYPGVMSHPHMIKGDETFGDLDLIVSCVDNNEARAAVKELADIHDAPLVVCQNDVRDAEAYLYLPNTSGMSIDPYERYNLSDLQEPEQTCEEVIEDPVEQTAFANLVSAGNGMLIIQSLVHEKDQKNYLSEVRSIPHPQCKKIRHFL